MKTLDVGCGNNKERGAIGIDFNAGTQADVVHDLNSYPYPFGDNEFEKILCNHIIEHIDDVVRFMEELHRIGQPGAVVEIVTPHFSNRYSYVDPTHRRHLSAASLDYFSRRKVSVKGLLGRILETSYPIPDFYTSVRFDKTSVHLRFGRPFRIVGVQWLANRFIDFYEQYLAFSLPARDLYFVLKVVK